MFRNFWKDKRGSIATSAGVMAIPLIIVTGFATDYAIFQQQKHALQEAADAAALASVRELSLNGANEESIIAVADDFARSSFEQASIMSAKTATLSVDPRPDMDEREVTVDLSLNWAPFMAHLFSSSVTPIEVTATAGLAGRSLTCIIGLMQPQRLAKASIHLDDDSKVMADDCAVYSNSVSRYGLRADASAEMSAGTICSAGGVLEFSRRWKPKFTPSPITDCPRIEDPLAARPKPSIGSCTENIAVISTDRTLQPGTYCGGLRLEGNASVTLAPGVHVIKDGPLVVADSASLVGAGVTIFLTGDDSTLEFEAETTIDLSAPEQGSTAGMLIQEDHNVPHSFAFNPFDLNNLPEAVRLHTISSNNARNLLGTIYLPKSLLLINANAKVADASPYTALIVGRLWLQDGPTLTINSRYTDTEVPVPEGLIGTDPWLVE